MVTPSAMSAVFTRICMARLACASCTREFTPMHSSGSPACTATTRKPASRKMPSTSVR